LIDTVPLGLMLGIIFALLMLSAFFSSTETALMSINRYRLRHLARQGHRGARLTEHLLRRPDRLIGIILLGNNLVNIAAASLTTLVSLRIGGDAAVAAGTLILTVAVLIFAEVAPKTAAARNPQRLALPAAFIYYPLLKVAYPVVWVLNLLANGVLRVLGLRDQTASGSALSSEELKTVVAEAGAMIPSRHRNMLLSILDLEKMTVDDVMVPRAEIVGIDLSDPWEEVLAELYASPHSRLCVWQDDVDNLLGLLNLRTIMADLAANRLDEQTLRARLQEPQFVPEGSSLNRQMVKFQRSGQRLALVVDEYGDIQGLISIEDILREIVGELGTEGMPASAQITRAPDGSCLVNAALPIRALNRLQNWQLPVDGPRTLNGLILERLERIPEAGTVLELDGYRVEITETGENAVRTVRIQPPA
jgi:Mg2+/Co2+ transporter CorB